MLLFWSEDRKEVFKAISRLFDHFLLIGGLRQLSVSHERLMLLYSVLDFLNNKLHCIIVSDENRVGASFYSIVPLVTVTDTDSNTILWEIQGNDDSSIADTDILPILNTFAIAVGLNSILLFH